MVKERPDHLTYLAIASLVAALLWFASGLALVFGGALVGVAEGSGGGLVTLVGLALLALGGGGVALAYGFRTRQPWTWRAAMGVLGTGIVVNLVTVLLGAGLFPIVLPVAVAGGMLWYLWRPQVQKDLRTMA